MDEINLITGLVIGHVATWYSVEHSVDQDSLGVSGACYVMQGLGGGLEDARKGPISEHMMTPPLFD